MKHTFQASYLEFFKEIAISDTLSNLVLKYVGSFIPRMFSMKGHIVILF